eukprot:9828-Alexandrium_andersonii.AAC.1
MPAPLDDEAGIEEHTSCVQRCGRRGGHTSWRVHLDLHKGTTTKGPQRLSLIHISEPTRLALI